MARSDRQGLALAAGFTCLILGCRTLDPVASAAQEGDSTQATEGGSAADVPSPIAIPEPVTCFVERPSADAAVPPAIDTCVAAGPDPILTGLGPVASGTSQLGWLNPASGAVQAYAPGEWAKLQPGLQGVGHAEMRLILNDLAAPADLPLVVEVAREVWTTCQTRLAMAPSKIKLVPTGVPGWWQPVSYMGTIVPMPPWMACGRWALFRTFWRKPGAPSWQRAQVTVRLYLGGTPEPPPP